MEKEITQEGHFYFIKGASEKFHRFKCKEISVFKEDSHIFISNTMTIYIFIQDINTDNPGLITMGYLKDWSVLFKNIEDYDKIKLHRSKNLLFLRVLDDEKGEEIYYDIKDGNEFNRALSD